MYVCMYCVAVCKGYMVHFIQNGSCTSIEIRDSDVLVVTDNAKGKFSY